MNKEYFDSLRPIQQAEVSIIVSKAINEMVQEQFNFTKALAFVELLRERLGQLDVVPRSMVEQRISVCGPVNTNPPTEETTEIQEVSE